ncbi:MAG: hypothetical protein ABJD53_08440, partial [Gammaproteobacteria bacterium]
QDEAVCRDIRRLGLQSLSRPARRTSFSNSRLIYMASRLLSGIALPAEAVNTRWNVIESLPPHRASDIEDHVAKAVPNKPNIAGDKAAAGY